jgi:hypothetical protein
MSDGRRSFIGVLGLGTVACVACCAGPILAFLGGLSLVGVASTFLVGTVGLAITAVPIASIVLVRRQRKSSAVTYDEVVRMPVPTTRAGGGQ